MKIIRTRNNILYKGCIYQTQLYIMYLIYRRIYILWVHTPSFKTLQCSNLTSRLNQPKKPLNKNNNQPLKTLKSKFGYPKYSMYDISAYIWLLSMVHVGKYTIHWLSGYPNRILHIDLDLIFQKRNHDAGFLNPESAPTIFCFCWEIQLDLGNFITIPKPQSCSLQLIFTEFDPPKTWSNKSSVVKIGCLGSPLFFSSGSYSSSSSCSFFAVEFQEACL